MKRRLLYLTGIGLFFLAIIGGPIAYKLLTIPPTCTDGIQNQGETNIDKGGPCVLLDERVLQPHAVLWSRGFFVRDGTYNAVAYIENPNETAGVEAAQYRFKLYDADNILIAERVGTTVIMPGGITPVLESRIDTGHRIVVHTYFEFITPLVWKHMQNMSTVIVINDKTTANTATAPQVSASVRNASVGTLRKVGFVAVVFDASGNAFAGSATALDSFEAETTSNLVFTWPDSFTSPVGHVDVIPVVAPVVTSPITGRPVH